jgi:hypothetical protein
MERFDFDGLGFQPFSETPVAISRLLFLARASPTDQRKARFDAPWVISSLKKKDRPRHHHQRMHATPHQCSWYGLPNQLRP